jgi:hypothetical protein
MDGRRSGLSWKKDFQKGKRYFDKVISGKLNAESGKLESSPKIINS